MNDSRRAHEEMNAISRFGTLMLQKLAENRHKPHWDESTLAYLMQRLDDEVAELQAAYALVMAKRDGMAFRQTRPNRDEDVALFKAEQEVRRECADVANFAMMIADKLDRLDPRGS